MTPSIPAGANTSGLPITKVIPVGRDGSNSIVDSLFAQSSTSTSNAVTVSAVSASGTQVSSGHNIASANVVLAAPITSHGGSSNSSTTQSHHVVHVQGPINVHHTGGPGTALGLPPPNIAGGNLASGYYVDKTSNLSLLQTQTSRPITLEKRPSADGKGIPAPMILTTPHLQSGAGGPAATVTIPLAAAHGAQHVSFAHPITMTHPSGHPIQGSAQIITTPISAQTQQISSSVLSTMSTSAISVSVPTPQASLGYPPGQSISPHAIPTHVISQPLGANSSSSAPSISLNIPVTTSVSSSNTSVTNSNSISNNPISVSVSTTSAPTPSTTSTSCTSLSTNSTSTTAPAQSPNTKSTTHSPRPSILRKQRELGDNHLQARAQRNLTLQLNFAGNNNVNPPTNAVTASAAPASAAAAASASANKENAGGMERGPPPPVNNNSGSNIGGISLLRKEFQPPNEETSWQSTCSSHSSGSTTISATSETAEYQMNQNQGPSSNPPLEISELPMIRETPVSTSTSTGFTGATSTAAPISQNGVVRSISSGQGRGAHKNSSKLLNKDIERLKREKEDSVSPRKKPRKQQL